MENLSQAQYKNKREEVLAKFREDFAKEYYNYDPQFRAIAEMLIRGADPYSIIAELIIDRKKLIEEIIHHAMYSTRPIVYPTNFETNNLNKKDGK